MKEPYNYDRDGSHTHCWDQGTPACGQPLENHKQCCLCDMPYPTPATPKNSEWRKKLRYLINDYGWAVLDRESEVASVKIEQIFSLVSSLQERSQDTVGELIEKCGKTYGDPSEEFSLELVWSIDTWFAGYSDPDWNPAPGLKLCTGSTPLEALQKLSEQLNQK